MSQQPRSAKHSKEEAQQDAGDWDFLPAIVLEQVLQYLGWKDRVSCSVVCRNWTDAFYSPSLWRRLVVTNKLFTRRRINFYAGYYRDELQHRLVQQCLGQIGDSIRHITVLSNSNYFNQGGFIQVLFTFLEFFDHYPMPCLERFDFTFNCENDTPMGHQISGTGGNILEGLRRLLYNMQHLKHLTYNQLLLNTLDAHGVLEDLLTHNKTSLRHLELVNFTNGRYPLFTLSQFKALHTLVLCPLNLTDEVAISVAKCTPLKRLILVQDQYTPDTAKEPVSLAAWWQVKELSPELRVQLCIRGKTLYDVDLLIQENAPVDQVVYCSPYSATKLPAILNLVDEYRGCLKEYAMYGLPRKHGPRGFSQRGDSALVLLIRECHNLKTLILRERISTATLLLLAYDGTKTGSLRQICVRRNGVILRCDWPRSAEWTDEFWMWLKESSRDYDKTEREVAKLLGDSSWQMLTDKQFAAIKPED